MRLLFQEEAHFWEFKGKVASSLGTQNSSHFIHHVTWYNRWYLIGQLYCRPYLGNKCAGLEPFMWCIVLVDIDPD